MPAKYIRLFDKSKILASMKKDGVGESLLGARRYVSADLCGRVG